MTILHAFWAFDRLHLWGLKGDPASRAHALDAISELPDSASCRATIRETGSAGFLPVLFADLCVAVGDAWDPLLVAGGSRSELNLCLPSWRDRLVLAPSSACDLDKIAHELVMKTTTVSALAFEAADAMDLLTTAPRRGVDDVDVAVSCRYWARVAGFALELLADQRFAPSIQRTRDDMFLGRWKVIAGDEQVAATLKRLAAAMPGVCHCIADNRDADDAASILEGFLASAVDAVVRRSLAGDELAHAIIEATGPQLPPQTRWLQSLVGADPTLKAAPDDRASLYRTVSEWVSRLEPVPSRSCRLHLQLDAPESTGDDQAVTPKPWTLRLFIKADGESELIVDARDLPADGDRGPRILPSPFDNAREQLRQDAATAARIFAPLSQCAQPDGPTSCTLTLQDAYAFLRDAVPLLELEGIGVSFPTWWREHRPRLRLRMDLRPAENDATRSSSAMHLDALVTYDWKVALGDEELSLDEITQLAMAKEPLVRIRGRWTEVQPTDLDAAAKFVAAHGGRSVRLFEALRECYTADDPDTGLPVAGIRGFGWIEQLLNATDWHETVEHCPPPESFLGKLRPYQQRGLEWLRFLSKIGLGACLADDMGLGKTIQLIALLLFERQSGEATGPTLLVVPMSLVGNWMREINRFGPSLNVLVHHGLDRRAGQDFIDDVARFDVVVSTYALAHRDFEHLSVVHWHRIALDEAQNIKNPVSKQSAAVRSLRSVHRVALTGTPLENRLSELWSILNFLNPGYLGGAAEFRRRFAVPIEKHHDPDRASRLRDLIRPFVLRRLKSDPGVEVDLPAKMEMKVFCNLTKEQAALYEAVVAEMLGRIDQSEGIQRRGIILATLTRLKQVCNHPAHFLADGSGLPHRSGKCDRLVEMLDEILAAGDRALVFTQYREMGHLLEKLISDTLNCSVLFLHGGTTRPERDGLVEKFQNSAGDAPILLLSLKAGGFGLNLTAANHVFHFDRWWNPAVEDQATDRAHRIGQHRTVQVHKFVCIGTLEERIDSLLARKRSLAENIIGSGEEWITELSTTALRDLFALSREAIGDE